MRHSNECLLQQSRDCPLLPNKAFQCPYAGVGEQCNVNANHRAFSGHSKVAFHGLTGHSELLQQVYALIPTKLPGLLVGSPDAFKNIVTAIWQDRDGSGREEVDIVRKISALDPGGVIFPRFIHACFVQGNDANVRDEYMNIKIQVEASACKARQFRMLKNILESQFGGDDPGDSTQTMNIMYQEYGGQPMRKLIDKVVLEGDDYGLQRHNQALIVRGLSDMFQSRKAILRDRGVAHMDLHGGNVTALEIVDDASGRAVRYHFRMIDFGDHEIKIDSVLNSLRYHDPIEYDMMICAVSAIEMVRNDKGDGKIMTKNGEKWNFKSISEISPDTPCITWDSYSYLKELYDFLFEGLEFTCADLYEFIYKQTKSAHLQVCPHGASLKANTDLIPSFQRLVYSLDETTDPETEARMLWDDYAIALLGIQVAQRLHSQWGPDEDKVAEVSEFMASMQSLMFGRFSSFRNTDTAGDKLRLMGNSEDGSLRCFAAGSLVMFVNNEYKVLFSGTMPCNIERVWFKPKTLNVFMNGDNNTLVLDLTRFGYRQLNKKESLGQPFPWQTPSPAPQDLPIVCENQDRIRRLSKR